MQGDLHAFQAFLFQTVLFVILAREGLHYANRSENFLNHRNNLALLLPHLARSLLDAARIGIHYCEQDRRHGKRNQREAPVDAEHNYHHAGEREAINRPAQQPGRDKALDRVDIAGHPADQVSRLFVVVIGE